MATTTNYGWVTPDDVDLVKDGAAAIRTLGSSADTTVKALNPGTTAGDIDYYTTSTAKARVGIGTAGQVLQVNSGATAPEWATLAPAGGMTLISETVASTISSLSLTSIPGTFKELYVTWEGIQHSTTGSAFDLRLNNDSTSNIYRQTAFGIKDGSTADSQNAAGESVGMGGNRSVFGVDATNASAQRHSSGWFRIDNYASTTKYKTVKGAWMYYDEAGTTGVFGYSVHTTWQDTSAVTSLDWVRIGGSATFSNSANTSIRLYGIS